jgi:hypothetical protein
MTGETRRIHHRGTEFTETIPDLMAKIVLTSFSVPSVSLWCGICETKPTAATLEIIPGALFALLILRRGLN